jgi:drug/metabolite transporter (DMT)-like permease
LSNSLALILLVLGSSLASSLFFVLSAKILRESEDEHPPNATSMVAVTHLSATLFLLPFLPVAGFGTFAELRTMATPFVFGLILLTAILHLAARLFHFKALSLADVSLVSPFAALTPVLTIATGWMILGESPNAAELVGILIIVVSLLGLTEAAKAFRGRTKFTSDAVHSKVRLGLWFAALSTVPPAFKIAVQKKAILLSSPFTFALIMLFLTGVGASLMCGFRFSRADLRAQFPARRLRAVFLISALLALNTLLFCGALTLGLAAGVSAMARISIVFQGVLAYWIAGQKTDFRRRLLWGIVIFAGTIVIGVAAP